MRAIDFFKISEKYLEVNFFDPLVNIWYIIEGSQ